MNIALLLSELRATSLDKVSGERLAAYADLGEAFCEWYSGFGPDDEIPVSWVDCRECLAILFGIYRQRLGLAKTHAGQLRCLVPMSRLSRRLRMFGNDAASRFYERAVDRFFTAWENAGFPHPDEYEEELDLLTLIYEDRRDNDNAGQTDAVCEYYSAQLLEILATLLSLGPEPFGSNEPQLLKSISLLVKSRGCSLDPHRDMEIRELCNRYVKESLPMIHGLGACGREPLRSGNDLHHYLCRLRTLQEIFDACKGWIDDTLYDRFVIVSGQQLGRLRPQTDEWWQGQSILLRQRFAECCV